jgi:hypothetical protein
MNLHCFSAVESEDFLIYDVPGDGQCFFHALSLAITGNSSQSLVHWLYFVNGHSLSLFS